MVKMKFCFLWLSLVCIVVFLLQQIDGFTELMVLNKNLFNGEVWRIVTAIFLHGSIVHLMYNLFALLFFGVILEKRIGSRMFLLVFFISGIIANLIAVNFYDSSLGASGAIYGVIGCLTVLAPLMMIWAFGLLMPLFIASILWVIGDILGVFFPSGTGNIAHLSGIAVGLLFGLFLRSMGKKLFLEKKEEKIRIPEGYIREWEGRYF